MTIDQILTKRHWQKNYAYDLVYEWEDIFKETLNLPLVNEQKVIYNRYLKIIPFISSLFQTNAASLVFEMECIASHWFCNRKSNIIPYIIDYYPRANGLYGYKVFNYLYKKCPIVFISSAEVYEHLLSLEDIIKVKIEHVALSLSDKYFLDENAKFNKQYDLVLFGRQSPVLMAFLDKYKTKHPDFLYVYNKRINGRLLYYTSNGELLDNINTREKYLNLMKKARCTFYTTPGIDSEKETYGFNQITPRFLEMLSCGCHIIARYVNNADSRFYQISDFCQSVDNYEQFEEQLNYARCNDVDIPKCAKYLKKHYTSERAKQINRIISEL